MLKVTLNKLIDIIKRKKPIVKEQDCMAVWDSEHYVLSEKLPSGKLYKAPKTK